MSAGLEAVTVTPDMIAPVGSLETKQALSKRLEALLRFGVIALRIDHHEALVELHNFGVARVPPIKARETGPRGIPLDRLRCRRGCLRHGLTHSVHEVGGN